MHKQLCNTQVKLEYTPKWSLFPINSSGKWIQEGRLPGGEHPTHRCEPVAARETPGTTRGTTTTTTTAKTTAATTTAKTAATTY